LSEFPRAGWLAAARRVMARAPHDVLGYGDPGGRPELREALAGYLSRARGVVVRPETVVVCAGYLNGLGVLASALREAGAGAVAVERYGHAAHRSVLASAGLAVRAIPLDGLGADLRAESVGEDPAAAILTPAHQFPLGVTLAADRRAAALRWAADRDALLVEDDYDGEYRYDRQPVGALQALDPEHVVYAGTASKSLAPGLRLAWLVLPPRMLEPVLDGLALRGASPPALDQLTLADVIVTGRYDRQIRRTRLLYRRRRDALVAALQREIPAVHVTGIAAGMHAVLRLPDGVSETAVVHAAARHGVLVEGLSIYCVSPHDDDPPALLVGYGTPTGHAFTGAVARLCAALASALG
jgi:GntR family transcriptional regulator/MocR family aminotransferase